MSEFIRFNITFEHDVNGMTVKSRLYSSVVNDAEDLHKIDITVRPDEGTITIQTTNNEIWSKDDLIGQPILAAPDAPGPEGE